MPGSSKTVVKSLLDMSCQLCLAPTRVFHCSDYHVPGLCNDDNHLNMYVGGMCNC